MKVTQANYQAYKVHFDKTCHAIEGEPAYDARFLKVLKFHAPGLAPVQDQSGAFHINTEGVSVYKERYLDTFGFYQGRAAVKSDKGWFHIFPDGEQVYSQRFAWCGNFQEGYCVVRDCSGCYFHIDLEGKRLYEMDFSYVGDFKDGIACCQNQDGMYTHIDAGGSFIHGCWFLDLDVYHKGFARAKDEKGWFHIDENGRALYLQRYASVEPFYNGISRIETSRGKLLLIDEKGEIAASLREERKDPFHEASGELISFWRVYTLQAALDLKVLDNLPGHLNIIADHAQIPSTSAKRLLLALCEMGLVFENNKVWDVTDKGGFFMKSHPYSLALAARFWRKEHKSSWEEILYSLKHEKPAFDHLYNMPWFEWIEQNREKAKEYHDVLSVYARRDYATLVKKLPLGKHKSVVDFGGGSGELLQQILNAHSNLEGFLFDLPGVIGQVLVPERLKSRMKLVAGDFFASCPKVKCDAVILSRVLHDWDDKEALLILEHARGVLEAESTGRIYIIENVVPDGGVGAALLDLNMLIMTGGKERTLSAFKGLLLKARLEIETIIPLNQVSKVLVVKLFRGQK